MSQANVDVVRAGHEAMVAGDLEGALDSLDPNIEWHGTVGGLDEGSVAHGRDEVVKGFLAYFETWERIELRAERYIDTPGDDVVVFFHEIARGRESGVVVETDTGTVNTVRGGRIVRVRSFMDRADALRAADSVGRRTWSWRRRSGRGGTAGTSGRSTGRTRTSSSSKRTCPKPMRTSVSPR
jgi:ketosteroid isomerase-like protein